MSAAKDHRKVEKLLKQTFQVPEPEPTFQSGLRSRILTRAGEIADPPKNPQRMILRAALPAAAALLLLIIFLIAGPRNVLAGVRKLFGYQPEIGIVEVDDNLRFLVPPPPLEREGLTITFKKGTADSSSTILLLEVEGFNPPVPNEQSAPSPCTGSPLLQIKDRELKIMKGQSVEQWDTGYSYRYTFPPLPAAVMEAELRIPCLLGIGSGPWLTDLEIPLTFSFEGNPPLTPVVEIHPDLESGGQATSTGDASPMPSPTGTEEAEITHQSSAEIGFELLIDQVLQWNQGTLITGHISWTDDRLQEWGVLPRTITITDAAGRQLSFEESYENIAPLEAGSDQYPWAYFVPGDNYQLPLTVSIQGIQASYQSDAALTIDVGENPEQGQVWNLDQTIDLGSGHQVRLTSAAMIEGLNNEEGYDFTLQSLTDNPAVTEVLIVDAAGRSQGGGGGGGENRNPQDREFTAGVLFPAPAPVGTLELVIPHYTVLIQDTWRISTGE